MVQDAMVFEVLDPHHAGSLSINPTRHTMLQVEARLFRNWVVSYFRIILKLEMTLIARLSHYLYYYCGRVAERSKAADF